MIWLALMEEDGPTEKQENSAVNFIHNAGVYYEKGFGPQHRTEFWYRSKEFHCLTQRGQWEMRVDYQKNDMQDLVLPPLQSVQCRKCQ